ncbi:MAG: VanW family protein [Patescibacteria group bacterium]|nr:VanW family protein [Patescibacteria group bacterium]
MSKQDNKKSEDIFEKSHHNKWWLIVAAVFFMLFVVIIGLVITFEVTCASKFYPNTKIGYLDVGGLTKNQALESLKNIEAKLQSKGLIFSSAGKNINIELINISATDPDLAKPVLYFDWSQTVNVAYRNGRGGNLINDLLSQASTVMFGHHTSPVFVLDKTELLATLKSNFFDQEQPPLNARLVINNQAPEIIGEQSGKVFDYQSAIDTLEKNLNNLDFVPIPMTLSFQEPQIKKQNLGSALNGLEAILKIESLKLTAGQDSWTITAKQLQSWLEFQQRNNEIVIGLNKALVAEFLQPIKEQLDVEVKDAKFEISDGRVTSFQSIQDGKSLNIDKSYEKINNQVVAGISDDIPLSVEVVTAKVANGDLNNLGIVELIGRGTSNFKGSPKNRRVNIAVGAGSLNGVLIKPGEDFSLLKALGPIDGNHGYLQELVIKGDRTLPEYGGGLCQIGTTTFRAALNAGLPITERRNHSYRVVYYEPAGMDATIYDPAPDMKFLNDTGHDILFVTKLEGDNLIFEFYGTKDGRQVILDPNPPKIYNVTRPGEPHYIETTDLKPGEKKIVEHAHNGADTDFTYTVIYPNGDKKEQNFHSHYVAWPEVWKIGVDPNASSTETVVPEAIIEPTIN